MISMNTAALKNFAPAVRRQLMEAVTRKLDFALSAKTPDFLTTYAPQVAALRKLEKADRTGLIERVAYTWFNRLAALRFMDARDWHPFRSRVLTSANPGETQPELLKLMSTGALPEELQQHTNLQRLNDLLDGKIPSTDAQGEVYRSLVLAACHFYHALLPDIFEKLDDDTELLLPDDLLTEQSIVHGFRTEISDEDCSEVEILGWLYQFYISEKKDQVMARKSAVPREDIPAVTQLFTPHWIVRYLVENSLGRLWLLNRPSSKLREYMPYYIEGDSKADFLKITKPEDICLCDPAVGSGHMLTYAFDLLTLIYEEEGYAPGDIPGLIIRHNLYGLEICPRAAQLAELALVFKAREKSRRFLQPEHLVRPHIIELRDVCFAENELRDYTHALGLGDLFNQPMLELLHQFEQAKNFGSLIQPCLDERTIVEVRRTIEVKDLGGQLFLRETHLKVLRLLEQAGALTQRYHVIVANPPYMGSNGMNSHLAAFTKKQYAESKADLMTCFMERGRSLCLVNGFWGMVNIPTWMFVSSFEDFRKALLSSQTILSLIHLGRGLFGADFGAVAFSIQNAVPVDHCVGKYRRLFEKQVDVRTPEKIRELFLDRAYGYHEANQITFLKIPGAPIAYWISPKLQDIFINAPKMSSIVDARQGLSTSDNPRFLRYWWEVSTDRRGRQGSERSDFSKGRLRWALYNKGGSFRRWYGNQEYVIWWQHDGHDIDSLKPKSVLRGSTYYFKKSVSWLNYTVSRNSFRAYPEGFIFDTGAHSAFSNDEHVLDQVICFGNSKAFDVIATVINPTVNFHAGNFLDCPRVDVDKGQTEFLARTLIESSKRDWDNFETSWDFCDQPLLRPVLKCQTLQESWKSWGLYCSNAISRMQELETENNRLFINAYGLDGELQPEVPEDQITLARADAKKDMAAFLSYAVGCMMGRYSLDQPGLILANAADTMKEYLAKVSRPLDKLTFTPDEDGIVPVLDGEWFEDDIVARTRDFLRATYGEATLKENIRFIEDSLGKDLRKYFLNDFYKDHLQTYKKRPIYWLVQSPKRSFSVLIYMHRYTRDTMNLVLNRYLRDYQVKLRNRLSHVTELQVIAATAKGKTEARKEVEKLTKILAECDEWERQTLLPLAQARIELDLDDGVKTNYLKLGEALAPIAGLAAKEDE
jgi:hypothetical protein